MWPFSRKPEPSDDLSPRVEKLERKVRDLAVDWDQTYEKFAKLHARMVKRIKDEEKKREVDAGDTNGGDPGVDDRATANPLAARLLNPYGR